MDHFRPEQLREALHHLTWWLSADCGIHSYDGYFVDKRSQTWVDENAADHKDQICGFYFTHWKNYQGFKYVLDQVRNASGLVFKVIPTNPKPKAANNTEMTTVEILIDCSQPNLQEKLAKATEILLHPFRERAHHLVQEIIDHLQNICETLQQPSLVAQASRHIEELGEYIRGCIDDTIGPDKIVHREFKDKAHHYIHAIALTDYRNDALVAQCYRTEGALRTLALLIAPDSPMLQTHFREILDATQFPDPLKAHLEAGKSRG